MSELVSNVIKETMNNYGHTIKLFEDVLSGCELFFIGLGEAEYHENRLAGQNAIYMIQMNKNQKEYCLRLVQREGQSIVQLFDILEELGIALTGLIIGYHRSVFRSIRFALDFLIFWADFEGDGRIEVDAYAEYSQEKLTEKDFLHLLHEIRTIRHTRIKERLII
jgi:hypothetical protein